MFGTEFDVELVAAAADIGVDEAAVAFDEASARQIVAPRGSLAGRYAFAHDLVRDSLHRSLDAPARMRLHLRVAELVEETHADDLDPYLAKLAYHWRQAAPAGYAARAAEVASLAGDQAMEQLAYEEGARLYAGAIEALERAGASPEARCRLLSSLALARYRSGQLGAALEVCEQAAVVARRLGDRVSAARAALVLEAVGDPALAPRILALCKKALADLTAADGALRVELLSQISVVSHYAGASEEAETASAEALAIAEQLDDPLAEVAALRAHHLSRSAPETVSEHLTLGSRMLDLAARTGDPKVTLWGHLWRTDALVGSSRPSMRRGSWRSLPTARSGVSAAGTWRVHARARRCYSAVSKKP